MVCPMYVKYKEHMCAVIRWVDEVYEIYEDQIVLKLVNNWRSNT